VSETQAYEAEVVGAENAAPPSACGMPLSWQAERLASDLFQRRGPGFSVLVTDLYGLIGPERDVAVNAIVEGKSSPFVLIQGRLACTGSLDLAAVLGALG
jgi:hypothetical protein